MFAVSPFPLISLPTRRAFSSSPTFVSFLRRDLAPNWWLPLARSGYFSERRSFLRWMRGVIEEMKGTPITKRSISVTRKIVMKGGSESWIARDIFVWWVSAEKRLFMIARRELSREGLACTQKRKGGRPTRNIYERLAAEKREKLKSKVPFV